MENIITQIKEAEKKAEKMLSEEKQKGEADLLALKKEKEKILEELGKNIQPKIKKFQEEAEKNIQGAKMMHKKELNRKLEEINKLAEKNIDKAVEFVLSKL